MPKRKRRFEVPVEAKLTVDAFDEPLASERPIVRSGKGARIDSDVASTGEVWSYEAVAFEDPSTTVVAPSRAE